METTMGKSEKERLSAAFHAAGHVVMAECWLDDRAAKHLKRSCACMSFERGAWMRKPLEVEERIKVILAGSILEKAAWRAGALSGWDREREKRDLVAAERLAEAGRLAWASDPRRGPWKHRLTHCDPTKYMNWLRESLRIDFEQHVPTVRRAVTVKNAILAGRSSVPGPTYQDIVREESRVREAKRRKDQLANQSKGA